MSDAPRVDVLVPIFNAERYLKTAIESVLAQTHRNLVVVAVDDGSTDDSPNILARLAERDSRIHVVTRGNGGIVEALNLGLSHCTADYVARHDADDVAYPERLGQQIAAFQTIPGLVAIAGSARHIDGSGRPLGTVARFDDPSCSDPEAFPAIEPYLLHPCLMFRRQAVVQAGGYRHVLHAEDTDLYWRLQDRGTLSNDKRLQCDYRMHDASISSGSLANGRAMAVSSQLAALSALRRRRSAMDLTFSADTARALKAAAARSLREACEVGAQALSGDEAEHLRAAAAMKLLDLAGYRPFELGTEDCSFIGDVLERALPGLSSRVRRRMLRSWSGSAARLSVMGLPAQAQALLRPSAKPGFYARSAARRLTPAKLYKLLADLRHGRIV